MHICAPVAEGPVLFSLFLRQSPSLGLELREDWLASLSNLPASTFPVLELQGSSIMPDYFM